MDSNRPGPLFAIGDVHGCADELDDLLSILPLTEGCTIVFLGDYVDRGPKSRQVVERVLELQRRYNVVTLRGNHEAMLLEFLDGSDASRVARFILNGGSATLATYADGNGEWVMPAEHVQFFNSLSLSYETPGHYFVHAGVPNLPLAEIDPEVWSEEMLWIRKNFHMSNFKWEKLIVHGHSVVEAVEIAANRINLDTGCVYDRQLSAMHFPSHRIYAVNRRGEMARALLHDASRRAAVRFRGSIPVQFVVGGKSYAFETVDYSEIGFGIRSRDPSFTMKPKLDDQVRGRIGPERLFQIPFEGRIVRVSKEGDDDVFGIALALLESE